MAMTTELVPISDFRSGSHSAPSLSPSSFYVFLILAAERINQSAAWHSCGKSDLMLWGVEVSPHLVPDCVQLHAHATHQFARQVRKMSFLFPKRAQEAKHVFEVSYVSRWNTGKRCNCVLVLPEELVLSHRVYFMSQDCVFRPLWVTWHTASGVCLQLTD